MVLLWYLLLCLVCLGEATSETTLTSTVGVTSSETDGDDDEPVSYEGAQLLRVDARSTAIRENILRLEDSDVLDTWNGLSDNGSTIDVFISPGNEMEVKEYLRENNVTYEVVIENVQRAIDAENPNESGADSDLSNRIGNPMTWNAYHSLADIYAYLDYLASTYDYCKALTIGTSVEGRPIRGMQIHLANATNQTLTPAVYIDGGMHAREWISIAAVMYVMKEIAENSSQYRIYNGLDTAWFYIFPVLNPDGYEYSRYKDRLWRKNRRKSTSRGRHPQRKCTGVDLNRNFGYKWGGVGSSSRECKQTYRGRFGFSEPETKAYSDFVVSELTANKLYYNAAYLSFHSYGQSITYPWSYDRVVHENYLSFQTMGNEMAYRMAQFNQTVYRVGGYAPTFYPAPGTSMDWFLAVPEFLYSYNIALRDKGRRGFLLPAYEIIPTGAEAMQAIISLFA